jgi:hypothetical protein
MWVLEPPIKKYSSSKRTCSIYESIHLKCTALAIALVALAAAHLLTPTQPKLEINFGKFKSQLYKFRAIVKATWTEDDREQCQCVMNLVRWLGLERNFRLLTGYVERNGDSDAGMRVPGILDLLTYIVP